MNNKGVTLVELLIVIVVMGIVAAFAVPSVGQIIDNTRKSSIYADALAIEQAADLYCTDTICSDTQTLTWTQLEDQVKNLDADYYDFTVNGGVIATKTAAGWTVDLEAAGTGEWEFTAGQIPSATDRDSVIEDVD